MRNLLILALTLLPLPALAQDGSAQPPGPLELWQADRNVPIEAPGVPRDAFTWVARPLVVFADSPYDPRFVEQMTLLAERPEDLSSRDVVVVVDTDPSARSSWRQSLRPRGFMLAILSKDGAVAARKPAPRTLREITRQIDKMPLRQQEIDRSHGQMMERLRQGR